MRSLILTPRQRDKPLWLWALVMIPVLLALGVLAARFPMYGIFLAGVVLVVGLTSITPAALPIIALPSLVIIERVGGGLDLSGSDLMLFAAFWPALLMSPRPLSKPMRQILWLTALYQAGTLFTVIANPFQANIIEWFHAWFLVGGALIVGWAVGRSGYASLGLRLFMFACLAIAALTSVKFANNALHGDFAAVFLSFPWDMHKNFIGCVLAFAAVLAYARPVWLPWSATFCYSAFVVCCIAIFASQARQALVSVAVVVLVIALRKDPDRKRSRWVLLALIPALYYVWTVVQEQLSSGNQFNSSNQRLTWYDQSLEVYHQLPWFGAGLRWWNNSPFPFSFQPPNAELEVLTSAGVVGLTGFLVMFGGILVVLWRINPRYGTLAAAVVLTRLVQGQFDLFWIAAQVPIPLAIAGICLGVMARQQAVEEARVRRLLAQPTQSKELVRFERGRHSR